VSVTFQAHPQKLLEAHKKARNSLSDWAVDEETMPVPESKPKQHEENSGKGK
jgi:hypothetical protein